MLCVKPQVHINSPSQANGPAIASVKYFDRTTFHTSVTSLKFMSLTDLFRAADMVLARNSLLTTRLSPNKLFGIYLYRLPENGCKMVRKYLNRDLRVYERCKLKKFSILKTALSTYFLN